YLLCRALIVSRFGRVYRGARENALRMGTIGFEVYRFQLVMYVIAGMIAGLAGFLLGNATDYVSPAYMSWQRSGDLLIMVILGGLRVTDDVTLDVMPGELHAVIGPNGAGKTTVINQISGLLAPDAGRIAFAGEDITALSVHMRAQRGLARSFLITSTLPRFSV